MSGEFEKDLRKWYLLIFECCKKRLKTNYENLVYVNFKEHCRPTKNLRTLYIYIYIQGGAMNRGLLFAGPPPPPLGAVSGKISEIC